MRKLASMYAAMFEGLRSYYARYPTRRSATGFHAAMSLSFLFCIVLTAGVTLLNYFVAGNLRWAVHFFEQKAALLGIGAAIAYCHVRLAQFMGIYDGAEAANPGDWRWYLTGYSVVAAVLLVGAVYVAVIA